ncbi:MAG: putative bifunctional DNA primase/polymerase [Prokaryotic dsDNA virus sp.]|jgi:hypothetical protein|nr:MAG: putative bifunctional DNA primase/polymerase [Prokaryotic dsDNA virus sp.]|tara:strand:+ start:3844 stop:4758 length:915 start_codon:yes stop_codon:yes gene_type:complete
MIIKFEEVVQYLKDIRTGKIKEGEKLGVPLIDQYIRFKKSNFNVILGHANVGKTTVILYLMLAYSRRNKTRWLIYSSENESHSILRKLVEFMDLNPINRISEVNFDEHLVFINDHFKIIDSSKLYNYRSLLSLAKTIKEAWNYNGMLIDPYNSLIKDPKIMSELGGHEYDYQATTEFRLFCKEHEVSLWLNTHANTQALRIKHPLGHEYVGHPIPPLASDVEGGGKFVNRADDFLVIHRYIQHPTDWTQSHIHIRKVKEVETGGRPTPIDNPIKMKSIPNNVGFEVEGKKIIDEPLKDDKNVPF